MLTLKTSVAAIILVCAVAVSAGATYLVTKASLTVVCPSAPLNTASPAENRGIPLGKPLPLNEGKEW